LSDADHNKYIFDNPTALFLKKIYAVIGSANRRTELSSRWDPVLEPGRLGVFATNPLEDSRWERFLAVHPRSSIYHSVQWLTALRRAYGYDPIAFTTSPREEELQGAIVFCEVESWLTRRRLVSLPFSDHAAILFEGSTSLNAILSVLKAEVSRKRFSYLEMRPTDAVDTTETGAHSLFGYCYHQLDLTPGIDALFKNCHRDSTQRKIRRAEREGLSYQEGRSTQLLNCFYTLQILTRRRHGVPPQPRKWFECLIDSFGSDLKIRVAFKNDLPVAAILTLNYRDTLLYKYGGSDARFHKLGGVHLLFWKSIVEAKQNGMRTFDLGRSHWNNGGLITFKDRWGAKRSSLEYLRLPHFEHTGDSFLSAKPDWKARTARTVFSHLPPSILRVAGELIYPHIG
jgi:hypothetical protein